MKKLIIKLFVKNWENPMDPPVRQRFGKVAGIVGICSNTLLSAFKIVLGFAFGSLSVLADGVNNLADASSSMITFIGFRMASKPADEDHPYGHARAEHIAGLIISFAIIFLGLQMLMSSIKKIIDPSPQEFSYLTVTVLFLAILIKIWQALFNLDIGKRINSNALRATAMDSRNDVIATSAVLISLLIEHNFNIFLDGWMGSLVALFILWSGIQLVRETTTPLMGEAPSPELVKSIHDHILAFPQVLGIHDLLVHDYGPGRIFSTVHVEVDSEKSLIDSHALMDTIEKELAQKLNVHLICRMNPIDTEDPLLREWSCRLTYILNEIDPLLGFHELSITPMDSHNILNFELETPYGYPVEEEDLKKIIDDKVKDTNPFFLVAIHIDRV
ncbi:MAG: cation diffusion facilitator family transporter [Anaerovoracaceae bacterium]|jgi:cation diffusion facilitator family transporter